MPVSVVVEDALQIINRLFDHRAAINGETVHFCSSFDSALDRQFETLLRDSHRLTEVEEAFSEGGARALLEVDKISVKMGALQTMLEKVCRMGTAHSPHAEYVANMKIHNEAALRTAMQEIESSKLAIDDEFRNRVQEISAGLNALSRCG